VYLDLRVLISSVETLVQAKEGNGKPITSEQFDKQKEELMDATSQPSKWTNSLGS
jgi:hypothetical protein